MLDSKIRKRAARREPARAQELIVQAAASVFMRQGFHACAVDDIARAAGYAPASVYKYFHGKEEILYGVWEMMNNLLSDIFDEVDQMPPSFEIRLRWLAVKLSRLAEEQPYVVQTFVTMFPHAPEPGANPLGADAALAEDAMAAYRDHVRRVTALMQQGIKEGALKPGDPFDYAAALLSLVQGVVALHRLAQDRTPLSARLGMAFEIFLRGAASPGSF
jgi:AcrR family transcriptional regulator